MYLPRCALLMYFYYRHYRHYRRTYIRSSHNTTRHSWIWKAMSGGWQREQIFVCRATISLLYRCDVVCCPANDPSAIYTGKCMYVSWDMIRDNWTLLSNCTTEGARFGIPFVICSMFWPWEWSNSSVGQQHWIFAYYPLGVSCRARVLAKVPLEAHTAPDGLHSLKMLDSWTRSTTLHMTMHSAFAGAAIRTQYIPYRDVHTETYGECMYASVS